MPRISYPGINNKNKYCILRFTHPQNPLKFFLSRNLAVVAKSSLRGCLRERRNILVGGTTLRCLTCRNFGLCGAQVEKDQEGINKGG